MLQHQESTSEQSYTAPSAAQARVTAEELAQAVAAVEARREGLKHHGDTIAIGEAVQQLGLNVTPEELLAEVRARRATDAYTAEETAATSTTVTKKQRPLRRRFVKAFIALSFALNVFLGLSVLSRPGVMPATPIMPAPALASSVPTGDMPLSSVNNDQMQIFATRDVIYQLTHGEKADTVWINTMQDVSRMGGAQWQLIKEGDKYYVRGWSVHDAEEAMQDFTPVKVDQNQHPLKVPIERLKSVKEVKQATPNLGDGTDVGQSVEQISLPAEKPTP